MCSPVRAGPHSGDDHAQGSHTRLQITAPSSISRSRVAPLRTTKNCRWNYARLTFRTSRHRHALCWHSTGVRLIERCPVTDGKQLSNRCGFTGQGTINVNSWSPDSTAFAYVAYSDSSGRSAATYPQRQYTPPQYAQQQQQQRLPLKTDDVKVAPSYIVESSLPSEGKLATPFAPCRFRMYNKSDCGGPSLIHHYRFVLDKPGGEMPHEEGVARCQSACCAVTARSLFACRGR